MFVGQRKILDSPEFRALREHEFTESSQILRTAQPPCLITLRPDRLRAEHCTLARGTVRARAVGLGVGPETKYGIRQEAGGGLSVSQHALLAGTRVTEHPRKRYSSPALMPAEERRQSSLSV